MNRLALLTLAAVGCTASGSLRPEQLARLDGYEAKDRSRAERELEMVNGRKLVFTADTTLALDVPGQPVNGRFDAIRVQEGTFDGRTSDGRHVELRLADIRGARIEQPQPVGTGFLIVGVIAALAATVLFILYHGGPN